MSEAFDDPYPDEQDERIVRIEMMRADTRLKDIQTRTEVWKIVATMSGIVVAAMGAGAGLLAGAIAFLRWRAGAG